VGILLFNAHQNLITANTVNDNAPGGPTFFSGGIFIGDSTNNRVVSNSAHNNVPFDIGDFGASNFFANNNCGVSVPPGIC
jgi:hypothetical protein